MASIEIPRIKTLNQLYDALAMICEDVYQMPGYQGALNDIAHNLRWSQDRVRDIQRKERSKAAEKAWQTRLTKRGLVMPVKCGACIHIGEFPSGRCACAYPVEDSTYNDGVPVPMEGRTVDYSDRAPAWCPLSQDIRRVASGKMTMERYQAKQVVD